MSAVFDVSTKRLTAVLAAPPTGASRKLITCWMKAPNTARGSEQYALELSGAGGLMALRTNSSAQVVGRAVLTSAGSSTTTVSGGYPNETWIPVGVYVDLTVPGTLGVKTYQQASAATTTFSSGGTNTGVFDNLVIGQGGPINAFSFLGGRIAEVAIWEVTTTAQADNIVSQIATKRANAVTGFTPLWYASLESSAAVAIGSALTNVGSTTFDAADNPSLTGGAVAPVLSAPTLVATSPTALTAGFTSDKAGKRWTVLTPAAQSAPLEAQIRAGQDALGAAAVSSSLNQTMTVGVNTFGLTGAPSTAYKQHTISEDLSGTPLVSNIVSSASETTPAAAVPPTASISNQTIAGQNLTMSGTYTQTLTSATAFLPAATPANGAVDVGPVALTYGSGTWSVAFVGLAPGDYDAPEITVNNGAGSDTEFGSAFTVMEIGGEPEAPDPGNTAEAVTAADAVNAVVVGITGVMVEAAPGTDTTASTTSASRQQDESGNALDAPGATASSSAAVVELWAPVDVTTSGTGAAQGVVESGAVADAVASAALAQGAVVEAGVAAETMGGVTAIGGQDYADALTAAETLSAGALMLRAVPESAPATETQGATLGVAVARAESVTAQESISGLVVMGVVTEEALLQLADTTQSLVGTIAGDISEVLVLTELQFQSIIGFGGVVEVVVIDDAVISFPIITTTTVVEQVDVRDVVSRLSYPRPPSAGSSSTRRFIVYYK